MSRRHSPPRDRRERGDYQRDDYQHHGRGGGGGGYRGRGRGRGIYIYSFSLLSFFLSFFLSISFCFCFSFPSQSFCLSDFLFHYDLLMYLLMTSQGGRGRGRGTIMCYNCNTLGHHMRDCTQSRGGGPPRKKQRDEGYILSHLSRLFLGLLGLKH